LFWWFTVRMPGSSFEGSVEPFSVHEASLAVRLRHDVEFLSHKVGERNLQHPHRLRRAAEWLHAELSESAGGVTRYPYSVGGAQVENLELAVGPPGGEVVVVGAHYDSAAGTPGANDNGSGVAVLLELARRVEEFSRGSKRLHLVAFVNEEPPYFHTDEMGSLRYARALRDQGRRVAVMLSLETMGYYAQEAGSQRYPQAAAGWFPSEGNFLAVVGNSESRDLVRQVLGEFRRTTRFPSEGVALSGNVQGIGWSDHWSFWQIGVPAVMLTDTAPYRYEHYHRATDTADHIDFERLARVTRGVHAVVSSLIGGPPISSD
jgi:hypothetical protein